MSMTATVFGDSVFEIRMMATVIGPLVWQFVHWITWGKARPIPPRSVDFADEIRELRGVGEGTSIELREAYHGFLVHFPEYCGFPVLLLVSVFFLISGAMYAGRFGGSLIVFLVAWVILLIAVPGAWKRSARSKAKVLDRRRKKWSSEAVPLGGGDLERQRNLEIVGEILAHRIWIRLGSNLPFYLISGAAVGWFAVSLERLTSPEWWAGYITPVVCFVACCTLLFVFPRVLKSSHHTRVKVLDLRREIERLEALPLTPVGADRQGNLEMARRDYAHRVRIHWGLNVPCYLFSVLAAGVVQPVLQNTLPWS